MTLKRTVQFEKSVDPTVLVVGAGLAGLAAAYALERRGLNVSVLEAAARPGGRTARLELAGFQVDLGANMFLETYGTASQMADQLGVPLERTPVPVHSGIYRNGCFHGLYGGDGAASLLKTARTMLSFRLLSPKGVWQAFRFARMLEARKDALDFDDPSRILTLDSGESAAQFFEAEIGTEPMEWLFGPGLSGYTFAHPEQIGAAYAMAVLWHNGLNGVAWPCMPKGGMGRFVDALVDTCQPRISLSRPVRRIVLEGQVAKGAVTDDGFIEADAVICATTASGAVHILPDLPSTLRHTLEQVTYSRCCRVFFGVDSSPLPRDWYAVGFPRQTGALIAGMSNAAVLAPEVVPEGKALIDAIVIDRQADELIAMNDESIVERVLSEVHRYLPKMSRDPIFAHVHRWQEAVCLSPGGTMSALHHMQRKELGGVRGLFLAGEYMGVPSVNAALRSGLDAAEAVIDLFGQGRLGTGSAPRT